MTSLLGELARVIRNNTPVPYVSQSQSGRGFWGRSLNAADQVIQMDTMGASATVFSIVNRTSTATAKPCWHMHKNTRFDNTVCGYDGCDATGVRYVDQHPALAVLNRPNEFYTRQELFESGQQHVDLTGEAWIVIDRLGDTPYELWPVRPDRMTVVTDRNKFLVGYIYRDPDGADVPLRREDVMQIRMPNPKDPYRGLGPVQTIVAQVSGEEMTAEYNLNFYRNGAQPGGVVKVSANMDDDAFDQMVERWEENHGGVRNAGRTAFLEEGDYTQVKPITAADMQFVEGANLRRDTILLAFGMSKFAVGVVDDVNRATAEASNAWFAEMQTVPRLDRWAGMLNNDFLPQFGPGLSEGYELVYTSPVPADREEDRKDRNASVADYVALVDAGVDPAEAAAYCDLPVMTIDRTAAVSRGTSGLTPATVEAAMKFRAEAVLDADTCQPCRDLDGKLYRNLEAARVDFPTGQVGYKNCVGAQYGEQCRCTYVRRRGDS